MLGRQKKQRTILDTDCYCAGIIPKDSIYDKLREYGDKLISDDDFSSMYCANNGRPSIPPGLMAKIMILQYHDKASDRKAAENLRLHLGWKYALSLPVQDKGIDPSSFVVFRARLILHKKERVSFDKYIARCVEVGILEKEEMQIVDSSPILGAGAVKDTYDLIRDGIKKLAYAMTPEKKKKKNRKRRVSNDLKRYIKATERPEIDWEDEKARESHLTDLVTTAKKLLLKSKASESQANKEKIKEARGLLERIIEQDTEEKEDETNRIKRGVTKERIISVNDPEMRHGRKSSSGKFNGFKLHMSISSEEEIITNVDITAGNVHDGEPSFDLIKEQEQRNALKPEEVVGDMAYGSADNRKKFLDEGIKPIVKVPKRGRKGFFSKEEFEINLEQNRIKCPAGNVTSDFIMYKDDKGRKAKQFRFSSPVCRGCELRPKCTSSKTGGRNIRLHYHESILQAARQEQKTEEFKEKMKNKRPKVERKISETMSHGMRKARCIGKEKIKLQAVWTCLAVNLKKIPKLFKVKGGRDPTGKESIGYPVALGLSP